jgi:hypothetical protein
VKSAVTKAGSRYVSKYLAASINVLTSAQYWNWGRTAADPINSPLFNGNMSSMGGNGAKVDYPGVPTMGFTPPYDVIPADVGGGCVTDGPFKKCVSII